MLSYYSIFYVFILSLIPHKEIRYLLPVIPFVVLAVAEFVMSVIKRRPVFAFLTKLYISTELVFFCV